MESTPLSLLITREQTLIFMVFSYLDKVNNLRQLSKSLMTTIADYKDYKHEIIVK